MSAGLYLMGGVDEPGEGEGGGMPSPQVIIIAAMFDEVCAEVYSAARARV